MLELGRLGFLLLFLLVWVVNITISYKKKMSKAQIFRCAGNDKRDGGSKKKKKCCRLWDQIIPIMSRLGLKANVQASTVCKTWFQAAVTVRKLQPRPWLFYRDGTSYILYDKLRRQTHKLNFYEFKKAATFSYSPDGWLLVRVIASSSLFLLNPFTRELICLPEGSCYLSAFTAAPTSDSCLVISYVLVKSRLMIKTWRPGATVWTNHC